MNRYTADKSKIIAADGTEYAVNVWHPLPLPTGIETATLEETSWDDEVIIYDTSNDGNTFSRTRSNSHTHWLILPPIPPCPPPKTQEELDQEAYIDFIRKWNNPPVNYDLARAAFFAGVAYARKEKV